MPRGTPRAYPRRKTALTTRPVPVSEADERFDPYVLRQRLGKGSSCSVYAAEHSSSGEAVAIKVLHRKLLGDPTDTRRLMEEAEAITRLRHPSIVGVFDVGRSTTGRPYVVLELLVGQTLSARVASGPLPEERILTYSIQLASALDVAHRAGIVHRDLKPENIYIVEDRDAPFGERVKLFDFGIAKREASVFRTATGIVIGTPAYMAPEQVRGTRDLDGRTDIYGLGVVMYVMATGMLPFGGATTDELLVEQVQCAPVPPIDLGRVSPVLSAIIERCLAKRPADRFARMSDLAEALTEIAAKRGIPRGPSARWPSRRVLAAVAVAVVAAVVISVLVTRAMLATRSADPADVPPAVTPTVEPPPPPAPPAPEVHPPKRGKPASTRHRAANAP